MWTGSGGDAELRDNQPTRRSRAQAHLFPQIIAHVHIRFRQLAVSTWPTVSPRYEPRPAALAPAALAPAALDPAVLDPAALDPATLNPAALAPATLDPAALDPASRVAVVALKPGDSVRYLHH